MIMVEMPVNLFSVKLTFESLYMSSMLLIESKKNATSKHVVYFSHVTSKLYVSGHWHYCSYLTRYELPSWPFPHGCQIAAPVPGITFMLKKKKGGKWRVLV